MVIPTLGINKSIEYIKMIQEEMKQKGYFIPQTKELLALTKLARKKFGFQIIERENDMKKKLRLKQSVKNFLIIGTLYLVIICDD